MILKKRDKLNIFIIHLFLKITSIYPLLTNLKKIRYLNNPKKICIDKNKNKNKNIIYPQIVDYNDIEKIKKIIKKSEVAIINNVDKNFIKQLNLIIEELPKKQTDEGVINVQLINIKNLKKNTVGKFFQSINRHILYSARFSGKYVSGLPHIDMLPSFNFYIVMNGEKKINLIPQKNTKYVDLKHGIDNVYVASQNWLNNIPEYYDFTLKKGEMLLFNNSAMIHYFENITGREDIITIRVNNFKNVSPIVAYNQFTNNATSKHFYSILKKSGDFRKSDKIY